MPAIKSRRSSVPIAWRQLRSELVAALVAVAAAVALVLLLSGLRRGMGEQATVYLEHQPPVLVGQAGARNFLSQTSVMTEGSKGRGADDERDSGCSDHRTERTPVGRWPSDETMSAWFATFFAVAISTASILVGAWGIALMVDPAEQIHFEYAIPALGLSVVGLASSVLLWRRGIR